MVEISIHAPREGSDSVVLLLLVREIISIHAPREGSDRGLMDKYGVPVEFQSTLPVRGATVGIFGRLLSRGYFNPRSP